MVSSTAESRLYFGFMRHDLCNIDTLRSKLVELDTPRIVFKLSSELYRVGSWTKNVSGEDEPESWTWRSGLSSWTRRLIDSLRDLGEWNQPTNKRI